MAQPPRTLAAKAKTLAAKGRVVQPPTLVAKAKGKVVPPHFGLPEGPPPRGSPPNSAEAAERRVPESTEFPRSTGALGSNPPSAVLFTGPLPLIKELPGLDLEVDCRQFHDPKCDLRDHCGLHPEIRARVRRHPLYQQKIEQLLDYLAHHPTPNNGMAIHYRFGIGCVKGRHRSVSFAEEAAAGLRATGMRVRVVHLNSHNWPCARGVCLTCRETP